MKPSVRINQIKKNILAKYPRMNDASNFDMLALIDYLDEVYEMEEIARYNLKEKLIPMD